MKKTGQNMTNQKTGMEWLRARMDKLGYTSLEEVANDLGINRGNLYRYFALETKPSVAMLPPMCEVFRVRTDEILYALEVK
jgi:transcriptional regulator with XRE-family HTH domain